jgi:hypothetical protein
MSRGLSKQQDAVVAYLRTVPQSTTQKIAEAVLADKVRERRGSYWYDGDARSTLLRSLHSLERRGFVVSKGLVRGEDIRWHKWSKSIVPTREMLWAVAPPGYTPIKAAQKIKNDKMRAWFDRIKEYALLFARQSTLGPGEDDVVHEDQNIVIDLCNYTDHERLLNIDELNHGHHHVVGIECNLNDIGYFRNSGFTPSEAMQAALEELGRRLQSHA